MTDVKISEALKNTKVINVIGKLSNWKNYVIYALLALSIGEGVWILVQRTDVAKAHTAVTKAKADRDMAIVARDIAKGNEAKCKISYNQVVFDVNAANAKYNQLSHDFEVLNKAIKDGKFFKPADDVRKQATPKSCQEALEFMNRNTRDE